MTAIAFLAAQRKVDHKAADYYPTPPWATRALFEHVLEPKLPTMRAWDPACGEGHMSDVMREYCVEVVASDLYDYGCGHSGFDFLTCDRRADWIITNPPFNLAQEFAERAMTQCDVGFALLCRLQFLEGKKRHEMFQRWPPDVAVFSERVGFNRGVWDPSKDRGTVAHAWFVWRKMRKESRVLWIPPVCKNTLTHSGDASRFFTNMEARRVLRVSRDAIATQA